MFSTPDVTPAQVAAFLATLAAAVVTLFKLNLSDAQQAALVTIGVAVYTLAHMVADAVIRKGRAQVAAARETPAPVYPALTPVDLGDAASGGVTLTNGDDS